MCGRFVLKDNIKTLSKNFDFDQDDDVLFEPKYNITPGQNAPIIIKEETRKCAIMRWGLVPSWSNDPLIGFQMIDARSETVAQKPSFKNSLRKRRCIVPSNGFYEWKKLDNKTKTPYYIKMKNNKPFGFAGLWDTWNKDGANLTTFTIITTSPNELIKPIHDRMPVILKKEDEDLWLNPDIQNSDKILHLLKPFSSDDMETYEISTYVNNPRNEGEKCIVPV